MNSELFKNKVREMLSQDYKIEFLGDNFDKIVSLLTEIKAEKIYAWIKGVMERNIQPISIGMNKPYKEWNVNQLLVFRYQVNIENNEYRILMVKVKNQIYIEFHFGDHKYYDDVRKELGLKKSGF